MSAPPKPDQSCPVCTMKRLVWRIINLAIAKSHLSVYIVLQLVLQSPAKNTPKF